jgi:hypothetical protein
MTQLRRMMLEEFQRRSYSEITTRKYLRVMTNLAQHFRKSQLPLPIASRFQRQSQCLQRYPCRHR